jgi:hypothetical protein
MTISKAQATNAVAYLTALSGEALYYMENDKTHTAENVEYNRSRQRGSLMVLRQFIEEQQEEKPEVKIVYEYKLRRADGLFMDKSTWSKKGKTYKSRGALSSALGQIIGEKIDKHPDRPTFEKFTTITHEDGKTIRVYDSDGFQKAYREWWKIREDKNIRAQYLPQDWTVIAIPVNTSAPLQEINVIDWYKGQKP